MADHYTPSYFIRALKIQDKTSMGENCFVEVQYSNWFLSLIARLRVVLIPGRTQKILAAFRIVLPLDQNYSSNGLRAILSALGSKIVFPWEPK